MIGRYAQNFTPCAPKSMVAASLTAHASKVWTVQPECSLGPIATSVPLVTRSGTGAALSDRSGWPSGLPTNLCQQLRATGAMATIPGPVRC